MFRKIHFLHPHLDFFLENLVVISNEHGERFHQEYPSTEKKISRKAEFKNDCGLLLDSDKGPFCMGPSIPGYLQQRRPFRYVDYYLISVV